MTGESAARLGELRRRQGRFAEAQTLFERAKSHPMAVIGRAALALDRDDAAAAADLADRYLRGIHPQNRTERVTALELVVRAKLALGRHTDAKSAVDELESIAGAVATAPLSGTSRLCRGLVAFAAGDLDEARRACEDAVDSFERSAATYETARARLALARVLHQMGRGEAALQEATAARDAFEQLQAAHDRARADRTLAQFAAAPTSAGMGEGTAVVGLSRRELDVLRLIAKGLSNQRVADQLFISEHTVHRHVANIFTKLGVSSRSAAVAHAIRLGLIGH
jgi:ATP/maltotriose-dependent transcriptional regulator MalT